MKYPPATVARRIACGVCPLCDDPGKPVASRVGVQHSLAGVACVEHLLAHLGVPIEPPRPSVDPPDPSAVRAAFRARLRAPHAGPDPSPTARTHARQAPPRPLPPEQLAAALLVIRELGAVPLRDEPTYGVPCGWGCDWRPPTTKTRREYDAGHPVAWDDEVTYGLPGLDTDPADDSVPSGARQLAAAALRTGWDVRVSVGPQTTILRAVRPPLLFLARYEDHGSGARFAAGWLRRDGGTPAACTVKQATDVLKMPGSRVA